MGRTTKPEYIDPIVAALKKLGKTDENTLLQEAFKLISERLTQEDRVVLPNGVPRWYHQMQHILDGLIEQGKICKKNGLLWLSYS